MKIKWSVLYFLLMVALIMLPTSAGAAAQVKFEFMWEESGDLKGTALMKNGVTFVPMSNITGWSRLNMTWDQAGKRALFDGWDKSFAVRIGSKNAVLDGKMTKLDGEPFMYDDELYIPARFVVNALSGGATAWDAKSRTVKAEHLQSFKKFVHIHDGLTYSIEAKSGTIYVAEGNSSRRELAKLGTPIKGSHLAFDFQKTPLGLLILELHNNYGEPLLNNQLFTLFLKDGKVIEQSSVKYWNRFEPNVKLTEGRYLLNDGAALRLVEDGTGHVVETINLVELGGVEDNYFVEYMDQDILLIRPNQKGHLTLVKRETAESIILYKEQLDGIQLEYAEINDTPYPGDFLKLVKREGSMLYFQNNYPYEKDIISYSFDLAK